MKEKGYYERLILPQNGLNNIVNGSTAFALRVVGNHYELMPLDSHLNQDLHKSVDVHCIISKPLPADDDRKFSKRTPKLMARSYLRLWDPSLGIDAGCPTSDRICEDINRIIDHTYLSIVNNRGRALHGAHSVEAGRRRKESGKKGGRGGKRVKIYDDDTIGWVHPSIAHLLDSVVNRYRNSENEVETNV